MKCSNCEAEKTPMWRKTLDNQTNKVLTLCNACGIYYKTKGCHRPRLLISKKNSLSLGELFDKLSQEQPENELKEAQTKRRNSNNVVVNNDIKLEDLNIIRCSNCDNINTSIWRRDAQGKSICNACGLFYKKKGYHRAVKKSNDDMFLSIDENLIRFNKIKRRNRSSSSSDHHITKFPKTKRSKSSSSEKSSIESSPKTPLLTIENEDVIISSNSSRQGSIVANATSPLPINLQTSRSLSYSSINQYSEPSIKFNANYSTFNNQVSPPVDYNNSFPRISKPSNQTSTIQLPPISSILNIDRSSF